MTTGSRALLVDAFEDNEQAISFCAAFLHESGNRYAFGCNAWAESIAQHVDLDGFVDDFTADEEFCGKPIIRSKDLPNCAKVVSAIVGERPLTAQQCIADRGVLGLDYFAFQKYSGLNLREVLFLGDFEQEFESHQDNYQWLACRLKDDESRRILRRLINFRLSRDILYMDGFVDAQDRQYFEPFLQLQTAGETFVDVGCFDGYTSAEFIRRCPDYRSVHAFEPEPSNMVKVRARLSGHRDVRYHPYGASNRAATMRFETGGSASRISHSGELVINVERVDDVIDEPYTFLKMDIEGGEVSALQGASETISKYHPRLALSVYHKADDLRIIPDLVLSYRDDYDLYLRHYTEGVTETVMFFVPSS
ncbi:MAG: FkbM family methyltransferase [Chromatiaceae bacterium]|nr:FkbM family methyltransferase [Chromatiaceae bacterium]